MQLPESIVRCPSRIRARAYAMMLALIGAVACSEEHGVFDPNASAAEIMVIGGGKQGAPVGTRLGNPIAVRVVDDQGAPVAGALLRFTAASGDGTLEHGDTTGATLVIPTDAAGEARALWTLGPPVGTQALEVALDGSSTVPPVEIEAIAGAMSPSVQFGVLSLVLSESLGLQLTTRITSEFALSSIVARFGEREVPMTRQGNDYTASVGAGDVPRDTILVSAHATDVAGRTSSVFQRYFHNRVPQLVVTTPIGTAVALPTLFVVASCTDDDPAGCASLTLVHNGVEIGRGTSVINGTFTIAGSGLLRIRATDSDGASVETRRHVFVEPGAKLQVVTTARGAVLDYDGDRVLSVDSTYSHLPLTIIRTGATAEEFIPGTWIRRLGQLRGYLTPDGAIFFGSEGSRHTAEHWRNGVATLNRGLSQDSRVAGNWAVLYDSSVYRRDLLSGGDLLVAGPGTPNRPAGQVDVATNGDVVYEAWPSNIFRYRAGVHTQLTTDGDPSVYRRNRAPRTDGTHVVYQKAGILSGDAVRYRIMMHDGVSESELAPPRTSAPLPDRDYAVNSGWVAFTRPDAQGNLQVWTRSPAGTFRQVSALGTAARIEALGPDGTVILSGGSQRYRSTATTIPEAIMSNNGIVRWRDTRFVVLLGNTVLAIN